MKRFSYVSVKIGGIILVSLGILCVVFSIIGISAIISSIAGSEHASIPAEIVAFVLVLSVSCAVCLLLLFMGKKLLNYSKALWSKSEAEKLKKHQEAQNRQAEQALQQEIKQHEIANRLAEEKLQHDRQQYEIQNHLAEQRRLLDSELEKQKQLAHEEEMHNETSDVFLTAEQIEKLESRSELPRLDECELVLKQGEVAVYGSSATLGRNSEDMHRHCHMYITNYRVAFVSEEGYDILKRSDIIGIIKREHGLMLQMNQGAYFLDLPRADLAFIAFNSLNSGMAMPNVIQEPNPTGSSPAEQSSSSAAFFSIYGKSRQITSVSMVDGMDGHAFEYFCADLLKKNGFTSVEVTKGSGDQGVDILAEKGQIRYAIQCKNYATRLGNTPIQEVNAGKVFYKCHVGVVMTNSTFTPSATELATTTNVLLWDRDVLDKFIKAANITLESI